MLKGAYCDDVVMHVLLTWTHTIKILSRKSNFAVICVTTLIFTIFV